MDNETAIAVISNAVAIVEELSRVKGVARSAEAQSLLADLRLELGNLKAGMADSPARLKSDGPELVYEDELYHLVLDAR